MADIHVLMEQLKLLVEDPDAFPGDEDQKRQLLGLSRRAAASLESPFEGLQQLVYSPLPLVSARICQDRGVLATLAASKDEHGVTLTALAAASGIETDVLESILDYICARGMAVEVSPGCYAAMKLTGMLLVPVFVDAVTHFHDNCLPGFAALHRALSEGDGKQNAFKLGQHTAEPFYTWMDTHPVQRDAFHRFMDAQFSDLPTWLDVVDFATEMAYGAGEDEVVFVDVGGGNGSQLAALKRACPDVKGRMVLQDQAYVLERAMEVEGMEKMAYDFLNEQFVKGARVYYFRQIIHNFDDETCIRILRAQLPALGPNSIIVLDAKVLPDEKPPPGAPG
ncbi:unnamed protein product [Discula destructiva]